MPYLLPPLLLTLLALLPLLRAAHRRSAPTDPAAEQRALIAAWRAADDPAGQDERDYRLYHELKALRAGKTPTATRLPPWFYPFALFAVATAVALWQQADRNGDRWHNLQQQLAPALLRSQYLGDIERVPQESLAIYCQALQARIDRRDPAQLGTLARCYSRNEQYPPAAQIYARAHSLAPDDAAIALDYAQTTLFAHPDKPMPADIEAILRAQSANPLAKVLLAAGYTQSGKADLAAPLWAELRRDLAPDHPLYRLIPPAADGKVVAAAPTITVHIAADTLATLPDKARLYVSASLPGEKMPLAVRALAPAARQSIELTDRDSMTGESISQHPQLTYRAILSADGNVSGTRVAEAETTAAGDAAVILELP